MVGLRFGCESLPGVFSLYICSYSSIGVKVFVRCAEFSHTNFG